MSDLAGKTGSPVYDECDAYDDKHGRRTDAEEAKPSGLTEAGNAPPPSPMPFKITTTK